MKILSSLAVVAVVLLLLPSASWSFPATRTGVVGSGALPPVTSSPVPLVVARPVPGGLSDNSSSDPDPVSAHAASATVSVVDFTKAKRIPAAFWGINVAAQSHFTNNSGTLVDATPVNYVRFPGGVLGEQFNYTSGVITNYDGSHTGTSTTISQFINSCNSFGCHAILQLPAETNEPWTAAYYAGYVVHTLNFQPAYWEIGNSVPGWTEYTIPWSHWGSQVGATISANLFANETKVIIKAVKAVDPGAKFLALGAGMGPKDYAKAWISALASVDGHNLS
ncbi:MAG: hypothetical protein L3K10_02545, partial [Thermoplasmata archaeon]|nr:hypothetical protein [Thermoplasmata archaeon]